MMRRPSLTAFLAVFLTALFCTAATPQEEKPAVPGLILIGDFPPPAEALDRARKVADELTRALSSRLLAELQSGGAVQAVKVCAEVAPSIAAARSDEKTRVRRVSLRVRNPADAPDDFEKRRLDELERLHREGKLPKEIATVVSGPGGRTLRYLRPIIVADTCLKCHGQADALDASVRSILAERYPDDRATGYKAGDLRGAVSVTIRLD